MPAVPRLVDGVEAFPAADGSIYLLRGGAEPDLVVRNAGPAERALLAALREGATSAEHLAPQALAAMAAHGLLEEATAPGPSLLSAEDRERYDRQLGYFADGEAAQLRLRAAHVTILGVGGLGSWTLCGLACAGVGSVRIVDDDAIDLSNLNRQLLYRRADVGHPKAKVAAAAMAAFDPSIAVEAVATRVSGPRYDELARWRQAHPTVATTLGWASGLVGSLLAGEVVHLLTGAAEPATRGAAITIDLRTLAATREPIARDPGSPACG